MQYFLHWCALKIVLTLSSIPLSPSHAVRLTELVPMDEAIESNESSEAADSELEPLLDTVAPRVARSFPEAPSSAPLAETNGASSNTSAASMDLGNSLLEALKRNGFTGLEQHHSSKEISGRESSMVDLTNLLRECVLAVEHNDRFGKDESCGGVSGAEAVVVRKRVWWMLIVAAVLAAFWPCLFCCRPPLRDRFGRQPGQRPGFPGVAPQSRRKPADAAKLVLWTTCVLLLPLCAAGLAMHEYTWHMCACPSGHTLNGSDAGCCLEGATQMFDLNALQSLGCECQSASELRSNPGGLVEQQVGADLVLDLAQDLILQTLDRLSAENLFDKMGGCNLTAAKNLLNALAPLRLDQGRKA
mmetsp:Transcript_48825/g.116085  ORF Transcript_48825/g.116085 Transcript_48825/m.116085 type:complete len:358 (-) Transcript_48825:54-1127(-)